MGQLGSKLCQCFQPAALPSYGGASDSEVLEDTSLNIEKLAPRVSMSANEEDPPSGSGTPKRKFSKFNIGKWCPPPPCSACVIFSLFHIFPLAPPFFPFPYKKKNHLEIFRFRE